MSDCTLTLTTRQAAGLSWARNYINANDPPDPVNDPAKAPYVTADENSPTGYSYATDEAYASMAYGVACDSYANAGGLDENGNPQ